ncbi:MAG: aldo/keto reductase [Terracidiphilus sp.]
MQYRNFGKLDFHVSALGFGCMRLPSVDGKRGSGQIDEGEAIRMIRRGIDGGINYLDSAHVYHEGRSEVVLGKALRDGYRERVRVATKLPVWAVAAEGDFDRLLDEQLTRLGTGHIDFYLLHALSRERWEGPVRQYNLLARAEAALKDGRIGCLGFSFHDDYPAFEQILTGSDLWSFCQIQYNYMDTETQAGTKGLRLAAERGLAVVVMEPLLGGRLADPPADIRALMDAHTPRRSAAGWALHWLWDQPEVSVVLSGMSTMEQVEENLALAGSSGAGSFTAGDRALIAQAREIYLERTQIPCTRCGYCMPCPTGVNIPANFEYYNYAFLYDGVADARFRYKIFLHEEQRSGACIACGVCQEACPQGIAIPEWMPKVTELLAQG